MHTVLVSFITPQHVEQHPFCGEVCLYCEGRMTFLQGKPNIAALIETLMKLRLTLLESQVFAVSA